MIFRNYFLFFLLLASTSPAQQSFHKVYTLSNQNLNNGARSMVITPDSGYIMAGRSTGDVLVIRTNSAGDTLWTRAFGETSVEDAENIQPTIDGGYIISGSTYSFGNVSEMLLIKIDSSGNIIWTKTYGGSGEETAMSVTQLNDGGFLVGGQSSSFFSSTKLGALLRLDSTGTIIWSKCIGDVPGVTLIRALRQLPDSSFVIAGNIAAQNNWQTFLMRINNLGDTIWTRTFSIYSLSIGSMEITNDGGIVLAGGYYSSLPAAIIIKTDTLGNILWSTRYNGLTAGYDFFNSVRNTSDGGLILTGYTNTWGFGGYDVLLVKTDSAGNLEWTKVYGDVDDDKGVDAHQDYDGGYVFTGTSELQNNPEFYLVKTDSLGNNNCNNIPVSMTQSFLFLNYVNPVWADTTGLIENIPAVHIYSSYISFLNNCHSVGVAELSDKNREINIAPNPFRMETRISSSKSFHNTFLKIINGPGQVVYSLNNISGDVIVIQRNNLPPGIYFSTMEEPGNLPIRVKLMITGQ